MKRAGEMLGGIKEKLAELAAQAAAREKAWREWSGMKEGEPTTCRIHKQVRLEVNMGASLSAWRDGRKEIIGDPCPECHMDSLLEKAWVPELMRSCRFTTYIPPNARDASISDMMHQFAWSVNNNDRRGGFVILSSPIYGNGKTHLAVAVMAVVASKRMRFVNNALFMSLLRQKYNGTAPCDIVAETSNASLLVFDDLGASVGGKDEAPTLHAVFDHRYSNLLPTVITTNLDGDAMAAMLGGRISDRLAHSTVMFGELTGASMRRKLGDEMRKQRRKGK